MTGEENKDQKTNENTAETPKDAKDNTVSEPAPEPAKTKIETTPPPKQKENKKTGATIALVLLIILFSALIAAGYFGWRFWEQYSSAQEQRISALESASTEHSNKVQQLSAQQSEKINNQKKTLANLSASQEAIQQRLDTHTQRLRALAGTSRDDWLLAEARYLLRLASQRLLVERGTDGARALLESADKILLSVDDAGVLPVRSAIANEIIALKLAQTVDRQGLYLQLAALKNQIQALPLVPFRPEAQEEDTSENETENNAETSTWYIKVWSSIKASLSDFSSFVKIREHDQAPELLVSEKQQLQTVNHLMFLFEQAQFALLHEEEMIYRSSLEEASKWWTYFYSHYNEYEIVSSEIKNLRQTNIIQKLPDINRSASLLTDYIERFHKLNAEQSSTATTENTQPEPTANTTQEPQS